MQSAFQRALSGMRWGGRVRRDTNGKKESGSGLKTPDHGSRQRQTPGHRASVGN